MTAIPRPHVLVVECIGNKFLIFKQSDGSSWNLEPHGLTVEVEKTSRATMFIPITSIVLMETSSEKDHKARMEEMEKEERINKIIPYRPKH